ncbi:MAG: hypothetical protein ACE5IK_12000 [Acidobacteriota bacterium]
MLKRQEIQRSHAAERGEGRVGLFFALLLLVTGIWTGYILIPIKVRTYEFYDTMRQEARFGAVRRKDQVVHDRLMKKAKHLGIPLAPKDLTVKRDGGMYIITARYTLPIDLTFYKTEWHYDERTAAPIF